MNAFRLLDPHSPLRRRLRDAIPPGLQHNLLLRRRIPEYVRAGIVFVHIPKNGGSSVNEALFGKFMGHFTAAELARVGGARLRALPSFAIARNPWSRALSAYSFAREGEGSGGQVTAYIPNAERYQGRGFETFERFVKGWLPQQNLAAVDPVFRTQTSYVCDVEGRVLPDFIGRLEDLEPTAAWLEAAIGRRIGIPRSNRSASRGDWRRAYDAEAIDIIRKLYASDFEIFGYDSALSTTD